MSLRLMILFLILLPGLNLILKQEEYLMSKYVILKNDGNVEIKELEQKLEL